MLLIAAHVSLNLVPLCVARTAEELLLADRRLTSIDSLESFKNLKKVELRGNCLTSLGCVAESVFFVFKIVRC